MNTINKQELPLSKLDDLYNKPDYIHISLGFNYTNEIILILTINKYFLNTKKTKYLRFDLNDKKFKKITLTKNNQINDVNVCNTITDFIKDFSDKINSNISEKQIRLSVSNESLEQHKINRNIVINGNYNENLETQYELRNYRDKSISKEFFNTNISRHIIYINKEQKTYQFKTDENDGYDVINNLKSGYINYVNNMILEYNKAIDKINDIINDYNNILNKLKSQYTEIFI